MTAMDSSYYDGMLLILETSLLDPCHEDPYEALAALTILGEDSIEDQRVLRAAIVDGSGYYSGGSCSDFGSECDDCFGISDAGWALETLKLEHSMREIHALL